MKYTPQIYESNNGGGYGTSLGSLPDSLSLKVTEERNGEFFSEMTYPAYGKNAGLLKVGRILYMSDAPWRSLEPFRITTIEKHLDGSMDVTAYHISYDLSNVIVMPFTASNLSDALDGLESNGVPTNDFSFQTDMTSNKSFTVTEPTPLRNLLVGQEGSLVDVYGGELEFSDSVVSLLSHRGSEKNIQIAYGKNLTEFTETDDIEPYDAVIPFAVVNDTAYYLTDTNVCATAPVVPSSVSYGYPRTIVLDISQDYTETPPTQAQLLAAAQAYISGHSTAPTANYATGLVDLQKLLGRSEQIRLCDTIYLSVTPYNIRDVKLKVIKTVYDALLDEYESVIVGDKKVTLADELAKII